MLIVLSFELMQSNTGLIAILDVYVPSEKNAAFLKKQCMIISLPK
jgi:hypothetical protein